jgi:hypothetical protein
LSFGRGAFTVGVDGGENTRKGGKSVKVLLKEGLLHLLTRKTEFFLVGWIEGIRFIR